LARRGGSPLDKGRALNIARKLGADLDPSGAHIQAYVRWEGTIVVSFGIRHSKKAKNGHIPGELQIGPHQALNLANCPMSKEDYLEVLRGKGLLQKVEQAPTPPPQPPPQKRAKPKKQKRKKR
jgi:hypothetical protein